MHTQTSNIFFKELVSLTLPLLKKAHKARPCWYHWPFHLIYWYQKKRGEGMDKNFKKITREKQQKNNKKNKKRRKEKGGETGKGEAKDSPEIPDGCGHQTCLHLGKVGGGFFSLFFLRVLLNFLQSVLKKNAAFNTEYVYMHIQVRNLHSQEKGN